MSRLPGCANAANAFTLLGAIPLWIWVALVKYANRSSAPEDASFLFGLLGFVVVPISLLLVTMGTAIGLMQRFGERVATPWDTSVLVLGAVTVAVFGSFVGLMIWS